jgi:hypothetical protein
VSEGEPKSAVEIAMEKLRARGDFSETPLSDEQKAEIADIRSQYRARIAEWEIKQQDKIAKATSFEELEGFKEELAREKTRLNEKMESEVQKVRDQSGVT